MMEEFLDFLVVYATQIVFTVGILFLFGFLISIINRKFYSNCGAAGNIICKVTGVIGTPVHELSHALFCVIFRHKILEIKLFQIDSADGTLGYVVHSFNKRSLYQRIGGFFIGTAPILVISSILYGVSYLLLPELNDIVIAISNDIFSANFATVIKSIFSVVTNFFAMATTWQWWVFFLIGMFLSLHMTLSKADLKSSAVGLVLILIVLFLTDLVLFLFWSEYFNRFASIVMLCGSYLLYFLLTSLIISCIMLSISFMVQKIVSIKK